MFLSKYERNESLKTSVMNEIKYKQGLEWGNITGGTILPAMDGMGQRVWK